MTRTTTFPAVALLCATVAACAAEPPSPGEPADRSPGASSEALERPGSSSNRPGLPRELARALAQGPDKGPVEARTPEQVVDQIVAAERAIADPRTPPDVLAAAGHLQQVAYRQLGIRPGWDDRVRASLPTDLTRVVRDNVASRRAFRSMHPRASSELSDELPAWRIVRPAPAAVLRSAYDEAEDRFGVDWNYLAAINLVETGLGRIRGTSVAGAQGPMQFIPTTWAAYGRGDINSPRDSILAAGRFLRAHGFTGPGGRAEALFRYNNSSAYVRGVTLLAELMERRPRAFHGYYHWQVYYLTTRGSILLPEGYRAEQPIPVQRWLARHE